MPAAYDAAAQELSRAALVRFVAERKRLAGELRAHDAPDLAARLEKRRKPPASAWAVNQLWWQERAAVERMLATASRLRRGELDAARAHHDATSALRERAADILRGAGLGASDVTLRRVSTTLAALAAAGGFAPDPPGALVDDREAPGFAALSDTGARTAGATTAPAHARRREAADEKRAKSATRVRPSPAERAAEKRRSAAERERLRDERQAARVRERELWARRRAERARLERELDAAIRAERTCARTVAELDEKIVTARAALDDARSRTRAAQRALASAAPAAQERGSARGG